MACCGFPPPLAPLVDGHAVELHAEQVVAQRAVAPRVLHHGAEVGGALHEDEERPLEARSALRLREEARVRLELVVQPPPEQLGDHLRRAAARIAQDGHDAEGDERREEAGHHLLHRCLHDRVGHPVEAHEGLGHEQREEVVLERGEVEVLVHHLADLPDVLAREGLGGQILEQHARHRRRKVEVVGFVQPRRTVRAEAVDVSLGGLDEVDGGHVGDLVAGRVDEQVQRDPALAQVALLEQGRDDVAAERVVNQDLPRVVPRAALVSLAVQVEHAVDRRDLLSSYRETRGHRSRYGSLLSSCGGVAATALALAERG